MKNLLISILCLLAVDLLSIENPEKEVESKVDAVTVFLNGAQVTRNKSIEIQKGTTILKFTNLSPFIDSKSIQVKAIGPVTEFR